MAWAAGVLPASPAATPARASSRWKKFWARPPAAVITLQKARDSPITQRALNRSAAQARPRAAKE